METLQPIIHTIEDFFDELDALEQSRVEWWRSFQEALVANQRGVDSWQD